MPIDDVVLDLARRRLAELQKEQEALVAFLQRSTQTTRREVATAADAPPRRHARTRTAAERKVISQRMKKYWAERRKKG